MNKLTESGSLEDRIGLFWLHRLGIGCLVLGFAFLLMYSFESFGPYLKLLTGFVASVSMIALGEKMATNDSRRWYGHGLIAGGWSIGYFTAYAAYFIDSVQVVSSLTLEMTILLAVAALSLVSALRANSEVMSILSVSLAGVAILLTNPGPMGDVAFVIIAISAAILGNFKTWKSLLLSGLAVCYLGHFISSGQAHLEGVSIVSGDGLESVFLSLIWLTYCVGIGYARQDNETDRKFITLVTCLNAALYGIGLALINGRAIPETVQLLLAASGAVYLSLGRWLYKRDRQEISDVNLIIGLSMINGAKALHFSGTSLVTLDVMQIAVLGYIGARYDNRCFRWFAAGLSLVLFPLWIIGASESTSAIVLGIQSIDYVVIGAIAAGLLAALSYEFGREPAKLEWSKFDRQIYQYFYYLSASVMALLLCLRIVDPSWQVTMITVLAGGLQCLSLKIKDSIHFCTAAIIFSIAAALTVLAMPGWQFLPIALVVAILYIVYAFARTIQSS
ncbi:MAG: DUF2339 domain-containing protein, partial [Candidatus Obscuribacterales bacterium]|nr:DUF2339 domain-containing protein [Candidatus Obscuribacterales bacterium]